MQWQVVIYLKSIKIIIFEKNGKYKYRITLQLHTYHGMNNIKFPKFLFRLAVRKSGGMNWIGLAPDRDRWRVPVNAVMNLTFR